MFIAKVKELDECNQTSGILLYKSQFDLLEEITPDPRTVFAETAKHPNNKSKNRSMDFLPRESW